MGRENKEPSLRLIILDDDSSSVPEIPKDALLQIDTEYFQELGELLSHCEENIFEVEHAVFILDISLTQGGLEGIEAIRKLKILGLTGPFIVLTSAGQLDLREKAFEAGADRFIEKSRLEYDELGWVKLLLEIEVIQSRIQMRELSEFQEAAATTTMLLGHLGHEYAKLIEPLQILIGQTKSSLIIGDHGGIEQTLDEMDEMLLRFKSRASIDIAGLSPDIEQKKISSKELIKAIKSVAGQLPTSPNLAILDVPNSDFLVDLKKVRIIAENLLTNAGKYGDSAKPVELAIHPARGEAFMRVSFRDYGSYVIPPHERKRIWAPFGHGSNKGTAPGRGVGLYIVRELAQQHVGTNGKYGDAGHLPGSGGGNIFYFDIPVAYDSLS